MGRVIADENGGGTFAPNAMLREKDAMLKGVLQGVREVKTKFGLRPVYSLKVLAASCKFTQNKEEVLPAEGDLVDVMAPTRLARQLSHVKNGETVTILYQGTKKVGQGQPAHIFNVTVEE